MPLVRFLPADDPRIRATVLAIADELTDDGLVLRYRVEETDDGLRGRGGRVHDLLVLARLGAVRDRRGRARRATCARSCSAYSSPLGLYAEEIDPRSGRHLGNFPQAFTHLALINAVMHVIRAEEAVEASFADVHARPRARARQAEPTATPLPPRQPCEHAQQAVCARPSAAARARSPACGGAGSWRWPRSRSRCPGAATTSTTPAPSGRAATSRSWPRPTPAAAGTRPRARWRA